MLVAVLTFGEHLGSRAIRGAVLIVGGGVALSWSAGDVFADFLGVAVRCRRMRRLGARQQSHSAAVVTRSGGDRADQGDWCGRGQSALAAAIGGLTLPSITIVVAALVLGALSYGASILLDVYALRLVGAAREAAYFATAPFFGAVLAAPLLGEAIVAQQMVAALLMGAGVVLLVRERHDHPHSHAPLVHEHVHEHDDHHQHPHDETVARGQRHRHRLEHEALEHSHRHVSDQHHRHEH